MSLMIGPFNIQVATNDQLKQAVYRLRYQVYCLESQFENPDDFSDQQECDEYEDQAIHILITNSKNQDLVATVRLLLAQDPNQAFHFEKLSKQQVNLPQSPNRQHYAEISRLAIATKYRNEESKPLSRNAQNQTVSPNTLLYASVMAITDILNIETVALVEPRFATYLQKNGITSTVIGQAIEHNGIRVPYLLDFNCKQRSQKDKLGQLYQLIKQGLYQDVIQHNLLKAV